MEKCSQLRINILSCVFGSGRIAFGGFAVDVSESLDKKYRCLERKQQEFSQL